MEQSPPSPEWQETSRPAMSLAGRLFNVFATPGEVFDEIKATGPQVSNWLVPALLLVVVAWLGAGFVFSQPAIRQQLTEFTDKQAQKQIERAHLSGEKAEQMRRVIEITFKVTAVLAPIVPAFGFLWLWALIVWLVGKYAMNGEFGYMKAVEMIGLSNMIPTLEAIVKTLLIIVTGNLFASPSLGLLVKDFDPQNTSHALLALLNIMTFWHLTVRAIGLARLAGVSFLRAAPWIFGVWLLYSGFFWGIGAVSRKVMGNL